MLTPFRQLLALMDASERRRFGWLMGLVALTGLVDTLGVASILPFLAVLTDPEILERNVRLAAVMARFGLEDSGQSLFVLGAVVAVLVLSGLALRIVSLRSVALFCHGCNHTFSARMLGGYLAQPYTFFLGRHSSDLGKSVLMEVDTAVGYALIPGMRVLAHAVTILLMAGLLFVVDPVVALAALSFLGGAYLLVYLSVRRYLTRIGAERYDRNAERYRIAQEALAGIKDVKVMGLERAYLERYRGPSRALSRVEGAAQLVGEMPRHLLETLLFAGMFAMVLYLVTSGGGSAVGAAPVLGLYAVAGLRMVPAIQQVYHALADMRYAGPALEALIRDSELAHRPLPEGRGVAPLGLRATLELRDLRYAYPEAGRAALNGLSLTIPAGGVIGIVGGTGAGKTTLVDLVLGLLEPQGGEITVDGTKLGPGTRRAWQATIGYVPQQITLVDDTVAANIAFGVDPDARDMDAVRRAASLAELDAFVLSDLPQGYDTEVGERGVRLSGGQRQRIGIARALYHDPDVLVLDEATSALDNITETAVIGAVRNLGRDKTVIMIAHRLSTVQGCDFLVLLEGGRIAAQGSFEALLRDSPAFRALAEAGGGGSPAGPVAQAAGIHPVR